MVTIKLLSIKNLHKYGHIFLKISRRIFFFVYFTLKTKNYYLPAHFWLLSLDSEVIDDFYFLLFAYVNIFVFLKMKWLIEK